MSSGKLACVVFGLVLVLVGPAVAQESTTVQKAEVEIVQVTGNHVVFVMDGQIMERDVSADFRVMVDGKPVPVSALVPGQKVQLEKTTTTTVVPAAKVTRIREGEIVNITSRTLMYREGGETKSVVVPADFKFMVGGKPVGLEGLSKGMKLTATIVTGTEETSTTISQLSGTSTAPKAPAPAPAPAPARAPAPAPAPAPEPAKALPTTASPLPLIGLLGGALFALGAGISSVRRRLQS